MRPVNPGRKYVLVTPTKNEAGLIGETIASTINQTVHPQEWVIVSDGSTDKTNEIVKHAAKEQPWIHLLALPARPSRSFASVVHATEAGVAALTAKDYDYIGLLDSDVRFERDYFEQVMCAFDANPRLGLAGGAVIDLGLSKTRLPRNRENVPGAVQFFKRECFEKIGRLHPIPEGGWDAMTCVEARMHGFETALLTSLIVDHLKPRNIAEGGALRRKWQMGVRDYALGTHPAFELAKCASRLVQHPLVLGSCAWFAGFCHASITRLPRRIPADLLEFSRKEQMRALAGPFRRLLGRDHS